MLSFMPSNVKILILTTLFSVTGIILSLGMNAGCAMNPSMDFCARWGKCQKNGCQTPSLRSNPTPRITPSAPKY